MAEMKKVWSTIRSVDCDALARYLEYMAEEGWRFESWENNCLTFEKAEAETAVYDVQVVPELKDKGEEVINDSDSPISDKLDGWEWMADQKGICILKRVKEDATPILTDAEKLQNVRKAYSKNSNLILMVLLVALMIVVLPIELSDMHKTLFENFTLFMIPVAIVLFIYLLADSIRVDVKFRKAEKKIEQGEKVFFGKMSKKNPRVPVNMFTNLWVYYAYTMVPVVVYFLLALQYKDTVILSAATLLVFYTIRFIKENIQPEKKRNTYITVAILIFIILFFTYLSYDIRQVEEDNQGPPKPEKSVSVLGYSSLNNYVTEKDKGQNYRSRYGVYHLNSYVPEAATKLVWDSLLNDYSDYLTMEYHIDSLKEKYHAIDAAYGEEFDMIALEYDHRVITIQNSRSLTDEQIQELIDKID